MPNSPLFFRVIFFIVLAMLGGISCGTGVSNSGGSTSTKQRGNVSQSLKMITTPDYCPYEFVGKEGELMGFDIMLAKTLVKALGDRTVNDDGVNEPSLHIQTVQHFNFIGPQLVQRNADFAMAAITPTAARERILDFSNIYYVQTIAMVSRYDQPYTNLGTLVGKRVGITRYSAHFDRLSQYSSIELVDHFNRTEELIEAIKHRYVDVGILDAAIAPKYVTPSSQLQVHVIEPLSDVAGVAIAFPPNSPLIPQFNQALATLHEQGKIQQLIYEWFDDYQCPTPENNE